MILTTGTHYYHKRLHVRVELLQVYGNEVCYVRVEDESGNKILCAAADLQEIANWKPEDILDREG